MAATRQRSDALARANQVRLARVQVKRAVRDGRVPAAEVILRPPPGVEGMPVSDVLRAQYRWGVIKSRSVLSRLQISETRPVGMLTERQRILLARMLTYGGQG